MRKHTFIREKSLSRHNCRYKEVDWFEYSEEEQQAVRMARRTRARASPPKIKNLNDSNSRRNYRWLFHNNFGAGDFMITLTFAKLTDKPSSQRDFRNFVKRVRRLYERNGAELKYLYVYEGKCSGTRPHYHVVFNAAPGIPSDDIVKLWRLGYTNTRVLQPDDSGLCEAMCEYLAKEQKHASKYERSWNGSANLKRPDEITDDNAVSRKRMRKLQDAARNDEVKRYLERIYIGWIVLSAEVGTNEVTGRPYAHIRLIRRERYGHYIKLYRAVKGKSPPNSRTSHSSGGYTNSPSKCRQ